MQQQAVFCILTKGFQGHAPVRFALRFLFNDNAYAGTSVEVVQFEKVDQAEAFATIFLHDDQAQFARFEEALAEWILQILFQAKSRNRRLVRAILPNAAVVFYLIEKIQIFRLERAQINVLIMQIIFHE